MKSKNRLYLLPALLLVLTLVLAACGGGSTPADEPATGGDETTTEVTEEPAEEVTEEPTEEVTEEATEEPTEEGAEEATEEPTEEGAVEPAEGGLLIWADEQRAPIIEEVGRRFTEEYGVPITVQQMGFGDIRDQLKIAGPAGEGADIIIGAHDWLGELVINGLLAPMDLGDTEDQFAEAALNAFTYDGTLYGMPYQIENVALFYNTELVSEAPESWEEVDQLCEQLITDGEAVQCLALMQNDAYHFFPILTSFGGYIFGQDEEGSYDPSDVGIDSEGSVAAAQWLDEQVKKGHIVADTDWEAAHTLFENGEAPFIISGPWALDRFRDAGVPYAITNIPSGTEPGRPFLGVQGFMISAFSEEQLLAQTFLTDFVATEEVMRELVSGADIRPSAFLPVQETTEDPDLEAFAVAGENAAPMPAIPEMSAVWSALGDAETLIFQQAEEAETAFTNAAEQIRSTIAGEETSDE